ncbi:MAG TPA: DUF3052 family protein [Acidimicrobiales bacterium]|nr:DUF3052 family protein [Acidimicrobiales bacterium]
MAETATPLARKLSLREGQDLLLLGAPAGWTIAGLSGVQVRRRRPARPVDVVVAFFRRRSDLKRELPISAPLITADGSLWVAWPRRAGGHRSDITDNDVRAVALPMGLVDVKVAALDDDWSGLKLVWRKELRSSPPGR